MWDPDNSDVKNTDLKNTNLKPLKLPNSETIFIIFIVDNKSYRSLLPQKTFPYPTAHFYSEPHSCLKSQTRLKILKYSINSDNKLFAKPWIIVMQAMHVRHYRPGAILISNLGSKYSIIDQSINA